MIEKAVKFAIKAHEGQFRKGSTIPYITHPLEVCTIVSLITDNEEVRVASLLHDTVEDTPLTIERIKELFGEEIGEAVFAITKSKDGSLSYDDYIERVKANPLARAVKISDLKHNMDLSRLEKVGITEKDIKRAKKYQKALKKLQE